MKERGSIIDRVLGVLGEMEQFLEDDKKAPMSRDHWRNTVEYWFKYLDIEQVRNIRKEYIHGTDAKISTRIS
jgi:hypothetical protein